MALTTTSAEKCPTNTGNMWNFGIPSFTDHGDAIEPKFNNLKEEVLGNGFAPISKKCWNQTLKNSQFILNSRNGAFRERMYLSMILKRYHIKLKHIVVIKLYTDHDGLQKELRKCFMPKYKNDPAQPERLASFYYWRKELNATFAALSKIPSLSSSQNKATRVLYHGVSCKSIMKQSDGIFYGPLSCTTDVNVAREFAGRFGVILVIYPSNIQSTHKPLDISLISEHVHEKEVLLFDHHINISNHIYSIDFDSHYSIIN